MLSLLTLFAVAGGLASRIRTDTDDSLTVRTRTGIFQGNLNDTYPDVRQFKWIPYAKPPVGTKRWTFPERLDNSSTLHDSSVFGPVCSQYVSAIPTVWALNATGNLVVNYGESLLAGEVAQNSAEDCLSLAVWTPSNATANSKLPVIIFMSGGGYVTGGINIPTQLPANWVHNSQSHIVVTINYRVNIFSFPNARGLGNNKNFGLYDQRMAVEWVHENIAAFGGDEEKITLWGQSAGASSTDQYLFAWAHDPIIRASVSSSGYAFGRASTQDPSGSNFTFVAKAMGCDFEDANRELDCMKRIPMPRIENFVGQYQDNSTLVNTSQPTISFTRQVDNKTIFTDAGYITRYSTGDIAPIPKIFGHTSREASALVAYPLHNLTAGPYEAAVYSQTLNTVCQTHEMCILRAQNGLRTWRYEWAGNFSNISPEWWLGAYHYSDLYMFFGTYLIAPGEISELEAKTSEVMQGYSLDFVKDPTSLTGVGWPEYDVLGADGGKVARFGVYGKEVQFVDGDVVEGACYLPNVTFDMSP